MIDWFEILALGIGFALVHQGIVLRMQKIHDRHAKTAISSGALILLVGAALWYQSARSLERLAETLTVPQVAIKQKVDVENIAPSQRREMSIKLGKAAFANGEDGVKVLNENGQWIPFEPDAQDMASRDTQLKTLTAIKQRQKETLASAIAADDEFKRWLASLLVAVFTGFAGGFLLRKPS